MYTKKSTNLLRMREEVAVVLTAIAIRVSLFSYLSELLILAMDTFPVVAVKAILEKTVMKKMESVAELPPFSLSPSSMKGGEVTACKAKVV